MLTTGGGCSQRVRDPDGSDGLGFIVSVPKRANGFGVIGGVCVDVDNSAGESLDGAEFRVVCGEMRDFFTSYAVLLVSKR